MRILEHAQIKPALAGTAPGRSTENQITVFDSTGVAVQDIRIAALVLERTQA